MIVNPLVYTSACVPVCVSGPQCDRPLSSGAMGDSFFLVVAVSTFALGVILFLVSISRWVHIRPWSHTISGIHLKVSPHSPLESYYFWYPSQGVSTFALGVILFLVSISRWVHIRPWSHTISGIHLKVGPHSPLESYYFWYPSQGGSTFALGVILFLVSLSRWVNILYTVLAYPVTNLYSAVTIYFYEMLVIGSSVDGHFRITVSA